MENYDYPYESNSDWPEPNDLRQPMANEMKQPLHLRAPRAVTHKTVLAPGDPLMVEWNAFWGMRS